MTDKNGVLLNVGDMVLLEDILKFDSDHRFRDLLCGHMYMVDGLQDKFVTLVPMFHSLQIRARRLLLFKDCTVCSKVGGSDETR